MPATAHAMPCPTASHCCPVMSYHTTPLPSMHLGTPQHACWHTCHTTSWHIKCSVIFLMELSLRCHPHLSFLLYLPKCFTSHDIVLDPSDLYSIPNTGPKSRTFSRVCTPVTQPVSIRGRVSFFFFLLKIQYCLVAAVQGWLCGHTFFPL